jgi:hypothetical protein
MNRGNITGNFSRNVPEEVARANQSQKEILVSNQSNQDSSGNTFDFRGCGG